MALAVPASADAATSAAGHVRVAIASASATSDFSQTGARNRFVILNEWETAKLRALKAANASIKVLLYQNLSAMAARGMICCPPRRPPLRSSSPTRARSRRPALSPPPAKGVPIESTVK